MWHLGTWFSRHGGVGLTVGLDDLKGIFQPMILQFYDSMKEHPSLTASENCELYFLVSFVAEGNCRYCTSVRLLIHGDMYIDVRNFKYLSFLSKPHL